MTADIKSENALKPPGNLPRRKLRPVEPQRLSISGMRDVPQPIDAESRALQMIAMEIDYGPFEREVQLPAEIDVKKVRAEQRNGLLWIYLPLKKS